MHSVSLPQLRREIQYQVSGWFGGNLHVQERTMQVLELAQHCEDGWIDDMETFQGALRFQPTVTNLFLGAGVDVETLKKTKGDARRFSTFDPSSHQIVTAENLNLSNTLEYAFQSRRERAAIRKRKRLRVVDLLIGQLQSSLDTDNFERTYSVGAEIGSVMASHILKAASLDDVYWTPKGVEVIVDLVRRLKLLETIDQSIGGQQFILYYDGRRYRFRPFGTFGAYQIEKPPLKDGSLWIARGNVLQPMVRFTAEAFDEIEELINRGASEKQFQRFFERYPEFLLCLGGGKYIAMHPQVIIQEDAVGRLIPDFFLEKTNDHFCDICDLKLSTQALAKVKRNRPGFYASVYEAIAQLEFYRNWFEDKANRDAFLRRTGLRAYRPRVVVIIGRWLNYYEDIERIQREGLFPSHVELLTYDDVVDRARRYIQLVQP